MACQGVVDGSRDILVRLVELGAVLGIVLISGFPLVLVEVVD